MSGQARQEFAPTDRQDRVAVLTCAGDELVGRSIVATLGVLGLDARLGAEQPGDTALVIVVSQAAGGDADFRAALAAGGLARRVPVALGAVKAPWLPSGLSELNWIYWDGTDPMRGGRSIHDACLTDVDVYRRVQGLVARAEGWALGGRRSEATLQLRRELRQARPTAATAGPLLSPAHRQIIGEFLDASATMQRWRGIRRFFMNTARVALSLALAFSLTTYIRYVIGVREQADLRFVATQGHVASYSRRVQDIKIAALIAHEMTLGQTPGRAEMVSLAKLLSEPRPAGAVPRAPSGMALNAAAFVGTGPGQVFAGGDGTIWSGDVSLGWEMKLIAHVVDRPLGAISVSADGRTVLAAADEDVFVVQSGSPQRVTVGHPVGDVAIAKSGLAGVVAVAGGVVPLDLASDPPRLGTHIPADDVLSLASDADRTMALVRRDTALVVFDVNAGVVLRSVAFAGTTLLSGALAGSGYLAVTGADGQLWTAPPSGSLTPTGAVVPDLLRSIVVSNDGVVFYAGDGIGVRAFDAAARLPLHSTCDEGVPINLSITSDGRWLDCVRASEHVLYRTEVGRYQALPTFIASTVWPLSGSVGLIASVDKDSVGALDVELTTGVQKLQRSDLGPAASAVPSVAAFGVGPPTAAAIAVTGNTLGVGFADGTVTEIDVATDGTLLEASRWQSPDHSAVRALRWVGDHLVVDTDTARWSILSCADCARSPVRLLTRALELRQPCYGSSITNIIPPAQIGQLRIPLCPDIPGISQ